MDLEKKEIFLSDRNRPIWQTIIGALFYTCGLYCIFYFFYIYYYLGITEASLVASIHLLILLIFAAVGGMCFTITKTISINLETEVLKSRYGFGLFFINHYSKIPVLEYVSVYKNYQQNYFEVKLWHKGNKHYTIAYFATDKEAFDFGLLFSNKLNLDLLDATEKGQYEWIDKDSL
ncbi:MAG: hypothetical protein QM710_10730 [Flavobacterium sp.]